MNSPTVSGWLFWKKVVEALSLSLCSLIQVHLLYLTKMFKANLFNIGVITSFNESCELRFFWMNLAHFFSRLALSSSTVSAVPFNYKKYTYLTLMTSTVVARRTVW